MSYTIYCTTNAIHQNIAEMPYTKILYPSTPPTQLSSLMDSGNKENLYLFNLQFGNLNLLPEAISSYSL